MGFCQGGALAEKAPRKIEKVLRGMSAILPTETVVAVLGQTIMLGIYDSNVLTDKTLVVFANSGGLAKYKRYRIADITATSVSSGLLATVAITIGGGETVQLAGKHTAAEAISFVDALDAMRA